MIQTILNELASLNSGMIINIAIVLVFGWYISNFAKSTIPRLLWIMVGLYFIINAFDISDRVILDINKQLGFAFILPHVSFLFSWLLELYLELKRVTIDSYVFMITIYYKIRNFFLWFVDTYQRVKAFFTKKEQEDSQEYYNQKAHQREQRFSGDYYQQQKSQNYQGFQEKQKTQEQQKTHSFHKEEEHKSHQQHKEHTKQEKKEEYKQQKSQQKQKHYQHNKESSYQQSKKQQYTK